jgi:hypothetical protein
VIGDRSAAPPYLSISRDLLQFNQQADVWLDVAVFSQNLRLDSMSGTEAVAQLEQAVTLYRGHFLDGLCKRQHSL